MNVSLTPELEQYVQEGFKRVITLPVKREQTASTDSLAGIAARYQAGLDEPTPICQLKKSNAVGKSNLSNGGCC